MDPLDVLGGFLNGFNQYLQAKAITGKIADVISMIENVNNWLARAITAIATYQEQEFGAVQFSNQYCTQIGSDLIQIENSQQHRWNALLQTILPNTVRNAVGYVYSNGIDPLKRTVAVLQGQVNDLVKDVNSLLEWRENVADPQFTTLFDYDAVLTDTFAPGWRVLNDWLANPGDFGSWAAAPVIGPIVAYLADPAHSVTRDNLAAILAQAWADEPDKIWNDLAEMLVS